MLFFYDETMDRVKPFEGRQSWANDFDFDVTEDGKYLTLA
jgi:hypothetical protein